MIREYLLWTVCICLHSPFVHSWITLSEMSVSGFTHMLADKFRTCSKFFCKYVHVTSLTDISVTMNESECEQVVAINDNYSHIAHGSFTHSRVTRPSQIHIFFFLPMVAWGRFHCVVMILWFLLFMMIVVCRFLKEFYIKCVKCNVLNVRGCATCRADLTALIPLHIIPVLQN